MKSRKTLAAPGRSPGVRMTSMSSSVTADFTPYACVSTLRTVCGRATLPKNATPTDVSRSTHCSAVTKGRVNEFCRLACSPRRLMSSSCTPRTDLGRRMAASRPASPPTLLHDRVAGLPMNSSMKSASCVGGVSEGG
eukprot:365122-Chlamydomonas_euryale.AAC.17